jgi:hypothetical protein
VRTLIILISVLVFAVGVAAQDTTATTTANTSSVNIFYVACETQGVINFDGQMEPGYDIYYQLFSGSGGSGQALSDLRQISVDGSYAVSEQLPYNSGQTVASGSIGSARVLMARETNSSSIIYETTVDDIQDGCNSPQNALVSSTGANEVPAVQTTGILSPSGGFLNTERPENALVVIGVPDDAARSNKPGEVFAECDQYKPEADTGLLYDNDNIMIFWSWYASSPELVQDHIDSAIYDVRFQTAPLINVQVSPIQQRGRNYWVFYTAQIGNLSPGRYGVSFKLTWRQQIDDGFEKFGPGTLNDRVLSTCTFEIERNPLGDRVPVQYNGMYSIQR